jgi:hypothetical protein
MTDLIDHPATLAEPLFTTTGSATSASLFDLFNRISAGESFELLHMAAHQRVPVVTNLALLMTVLRRHAPTPPVTATEWHTAWLTQIGSDALRLVAPETEVAFLQPPLDPAGFRSAMSLSDIDLTFAKLAHAVKPIDTGSAEAAVLALMGGTWKSSALKWVGGSRYGIAAVLASDDGTLAGEVRHLVAAYKSHPSDMIGRYAHASRAAEHLLWLRPVTQSGLDPDRIPWPYQEARPVHLVRVKAGVYSGIGQHSAPRRLAGAVHADDPHVPLIQGQPYRLSDQRPWSLSSLHEMLFGSERTTRPRTLDLSGYRCVRVCAVTTRQATTRGYQESFHPLAQGASFSLFSRPERAADLSQRALDSAFLVSGKLAHAAGLLVSGTDRSAAVRASRLAAKARFLGDVGERMTQAVLNLLGEPEDLAREQADLHATAVAVARVVWQRLITGCHRPLAVANATAYLEYQFRRLTESSPPTETWVLVRQCHGILREIVQHLTPEQRAKLRSMVPSRPALAYYTGLAAVPESLRAAPIWSVILPALGRMQPSDRHPGRALAATDYPELRLQRLLAATGEALVNQIGSVCAWLVSREVTAVDLGLLAALGVADWRNDSETRGVLRTQLALGYVNQTRRNAAA